MIEFKWIFGFLALVGLYYVFVMLVFQANAIAKRREMERRLSELLNVSIPGLEIALDQLAQAGMRAAEAGRKTLKLARELRKHNTLNTIKGNSDVA